MGVKGTHFPMVGIRLNPTFLTFELSLPKLVVFVTFLIIIKICIPLSFNLILYILFLASLV